VYYHSKWNMERAEKFTLRNLDIKTICHPNFLTQRLTSRDVDSSFRYRRSLIARRVWSQSGRSSSIGRLYKKRYSISYYSFYFAATFSRRIARGETWTGSSVTPGNENAGVSLRRSDFYFAYLIFFVQYFYRATLPTKTLSNSSL